MKELKEVCESVQGEFRVNDYKRPFATTPESAFVKGCYSIISKVKPTAQIITQPSANEASLWSRIGVECLAFGAGKRDGNIHTPNEHVAIDDLKRSIQVYQSVMERFCL